MTSTTGGQNASHEKKKKEKKIKVGQPQTEPRNVEEDRQIGEGGRRDGAEGTRKNESFRDERKDQLSHCGASESKNDRGELLFLDGARSARARPLLFLMACKMQPRSRYLCTKGRLNGLGKVNQIFISLSGGTISYLSKSS